MFALVDMCVQGTCLQAGRAFPALPMWLTAHCLQVGERGISRPLHRHFHCPGVAAHRQLMPSGLKQKQPDAENMGTVRALSVTWS